MGYIKVYVTNYQIEIFKYERNIDIDRIAGSHGVHNNRKDLVDAGGIPESEGASTDRKTKRYDNARRASVSFKRLVKANLGGTENPLLLTLTFGQNLTNLAEANRSFTAFVQALKYRQGNSTRYIAVPEFQKRGAVHFHIIAWGVDKAVLGVPRKWPVNSVSCPFWTHGYAFVKETDGHARIATYLAKYMQKAFLDPRLAGHKAYMSSRNVIRPVVYRGISNIALSYLLDDTLSTGATMTRQEQFDTMFLGRCDLQVYTKIK